MSIEEKLNEVRKIVQEWADMQGHDRCHYYPELFKRLAAVLDIKSNNVPHLPPIAEFKRGCEQYQREEYGESYMP